MPYTPVELRHVKLGRSLLGFKRDETERLLTDVADSFEDVWRERGELTDKVHELQQGLDEIRQREALLSSTLVSAERAAVESKEAAKREAELIVAEAHGEARSIMRAAQSERERLFGEARRVEALLRSALDIVADSRVGVGEASEVAAGPAPAPAADPAAEDSRVEGAQPVPQVPSLPPAPEHWPRREDTREFAVVRTDDAEPDPAVAEAPPALPEPAPPAEPTESAAREFAWGD